MRHPLRGYLELASTARVAELLDQARARLESLSSAGTTADGHAEIYAQVHRLLTEALQATAAGV